MADILDLSKFDGHTIDKMEMYERWLAEIETELEESDG
jgi:hypothetical protein